MNEKKIYHNYGNNNIPTNDKKLNNNINNQNKRQFLPNATLISEITIPSLNVVLFFRRKKTKTNESEIEIEKRKREKEFEKKENKTNKNKTRK